MQKTKLSDLLPKPISVEVDEGHVLLMYPLTLAEVGKLVLRFGTALEAFADPKNANYDQLVTQFPDFIRTVLGLSMKADEAEWEMIDLLPAGVQLIALKATWDATVPTPKKLQELLAVVTPMLTKVANDRRPASSQGNQTVAISSESSKKESPSQSGTYVHEGIV